MQEIKFEDKIQSLCDVSLFSSDMLKKNRLERICLIHNVVLVKLWSLAEKNMYLKQVQKVVKSEIYCKS